MLAALAPYLYDTVRALGMLIGNKPHNLPSINSLKAATTRFPDHMRNCEDVVLDTSHGIALFSCSPGRDTWNTVMVSTTTKPNIFSAFIETT